MSDGVFVGGIVGAPLGGGDGVCEGLGDGAVVGWLVWGFVGPIEGFELGRSDG
jgi:hypothetical protein